MLGRGLFVSGGAFGEDGPGHDSRRLTAADGHAGPADADDHRSHAVVDLDRQLAAWDEAHSGQPFCKG